MSDKKLLFIHVPKTGGLSVTAAMRDGNLDFLKHTRAHWTAEERRNVLGQEQFDAATKFAVVREPVARYTSACRQLRLNPNSEQALRLAEAQRGGFFNGRLLLKQARYLMVDGEVAIDKLFRFEEDVPENIYQFLLDEGMEDIGGLPHRHNRRRPLPTLRPKVEERVRKIYAQDFELFGY